jgi:hypothetical protein
MDIVTQFVASAQVCTIGGFIESDPAPPARTSADYMLRFRSRQRHEVADCL